MTPGSRARTHHAGERDLRPASDGCPVAAAAFHTSGPYAAVATGELRTADGMVHADTTLSCAWWTRASRIAHSRARRELSLPSTPTTIRCIASSSGLGERRRSARAQVDPAEQFGVE